MRSLGHATRFVVTTLALVLAASACKRTVPVETTSGSRAKLAPGDSFNPSNGDLHIIFQRVTGDSRCPTGVVCAWAGNATVELSVSSRSARFATSTYTLNTTLDPREVVIMGQRIRLELLDPAPISTTPTLPTSYRVTLSAVWLPD